MIKAKYLGYKCERLDSGKIYPITTQCRGSHLIVTVKGEKLSYNNLERFLKEWKVEAVYRG